MRSGITPRSIVSVFLVVLALYLTGFYGLEHLRHRKGPWQVAFQTNEQSDPVVSMAQSSLGLRDVRLVFHGESATNGGGTVLFDRVQRPVPFGKVIYEDLTFLPGVVTFNLFGHEIELLPRVLVVNKREVPWRSGTVIDLWPTNKPAQPPKSPGDHARPSKR